MNNELLPDGVYIMQAHGKVLNDFEKDTQISTDWFNEISIPFFFLPFIFLLS